MKPETIIDNVMREMRIQKMTRRTLAAKTGIDYQRLCRMIRGDRRIRADELRPLAGALGISVKRLIGEDDGS